MEDVLCRNLRCFVDSFRSRTDISEKLSSSLLCDTLLLVGDQVGNNRQTCRRCLTNVHVQYNANVRNVY